MCLSLIKDKRERRLVLFHYDEGKLCYISFDKACTWDNILEDCTNYDTIKVYQSPTGSLIFNTTDIIFNSDDYKIKELTLQEIADKFGIKVENLIIKE